MVAVALHRTSLHCSTQCQFHRQAEEVSSLDTALARVQRVQLDYTP